jgi:prepilin-type N-terminal cleavage/methylation domain-containing protein
MSILDPQKNKGFTLIEIAIVMVVIGLLTGGGISILRVMTERKIRTENLDYLQKAKEAILSFADINGRLPRPDTGTDGREDAFATNQNCVGLLPFMTLNIAPTDAYQRRVKYEISNNPANLIANRGTTCNTLRAWNPASGSRPLLVDIGSPTPFTAAAILVSGGPTDADGAGGAFDAIAGAAGGNNITGTPQYIRSSPTRTFDDVVVFIGGYELNSKMACSAADVCSSTGIGVQNTGSITLYYKKNSVPPCLAWNPSPNPLTDTIFLLPPDLYDIYTDSGCTSPCLNLNGHAIAITYSQQEGIDVDRDCLTGFKFVNGNGNMIDR